MLMRFKKQWPSEALLLLVALCFGCSPLGEQIQEETTHKNGSVTPMTQESASMPADLRAAYVAARQANGGERYHAEIDAFGAARFVHLEQRYEAQVDGTTVLLSALGDANWTLSLRAIQVGCEGAAGRELEASAVVPSGNRVEITHGSMLEWYVNGPLGLEQGFTLQQAPECAGPKVLTMAVAGNLRPKLEADEGNGRGQAVAFVDTTDAAVVRYTDLYVKDANGKHVSAWMNVADGNLSLHVEDAGATYPLEIDPLVWVEQAQLLAGDGAANANFGWVVALSTDTALIGANADDVGMNINQGSAYVFTRNGTAWTQQAKLTASDGAANDFFGQSVALSGDTALVGASGDDAPNTNRGSAYVFTRSGTVWTEQAKLIAADGATDDMFGSAVALVGDTALVAATNDDVGANTDQGSAYVFTRSGVMWTQQAKLTASDGAASDTFGSAVALVGDTALVGANGDDVGANPDQGSAYVFTRSGVTWTQQAKLTANDGANSDAFGGSVALSVDTALVGASNDDIGANNNQGSVYVFTGSGAMWTQQAKLTANDGATNDMFGSSVALSGDTALVGASNDDVGANSNQGSAHVFTRSGTMWSLQRKLTASDGADSDLFGVSVALLGDTALVGAVYDNVGANSNQGSVYVFRFVLVGDPCANAAQCASGFCVDGVCCNTACGGSLPGDCQACSVAAGSLENGICAPIAMGTQCRAAADVCDVAESCDGASNACPADAKVAMGTECRASAGVCDSAESCDGASNACPADAKVAMGTECRASAGVCDSAESCDGASNACPADAKVAMGTECRAAAGDCDAVESCDGASADCPADGNLPNGTSCPMGTCTDGACAGEGGSGGAGGSAGNGGAGGGGAAGGGAGTGGMAGAGGSSETGGAGGGGGNDVGGASGCDCRTTGQSTNGGSGPGALLGLALVALTVVRRRR